MAAAQETVLARSAAPPHNLPTELTSFVGREDAIGVLKRTVPTTRLVTLTGSGGVGKTRLALRVAAELLPDFPDGICFVDLAPVVDETLVAHAALAACALRDRRGVPPCDRLVAHLRTRRCLLVLDNCEHVVHA